MSAAVAILPPIPRSRPRSPLSRSAGEGPGVRVAPHLAPGPLPLPYGERKGEMSAAVAILPPIPRSRTRSPLSRSAGEGPGVRAIRNAGAGSGVRATFQNTPTHPHSQRSLHSRFDHCVRWGDRRIVRRARPPVVGLHPAIQSCVECR